MKGKIYSYLLILFFTILMIACQTNQSENKVISDNIDNIEDYSFEDDENDENIPSLKAILVIIDDYNNPEYNIISQSVKKDLEIMQQFIKFIDDKKILKVNTNILRNERATIQNIKNTIENIKDNNDDVMLLYFSGYGGVKSDKAFIYTIENKEIYQNDVENIIKNKKDRLKIIINNACNNSINNVLKGINFSLGARSRNDPIKTFKELFYDYEGLLSISVLSENEFSWGGNEGSTFTSSFVNDVLLKNPKNTWEENIARTQKSIRQKFTNIINKIELDKDTKQEIKEKNINNQTIRIYSMPKNVNNSTTYKSNDYRNNVNIMNETSNVVKFTIENNDKVKDYALNIGEDIAIESDNIIYLFYNGKSYGVEGGDYTFSEQDSKICLNYIDEKTGNYDSGWNEDTKKWSTFETNLDNWWDNDTSTSVDDEDWNDIYHNGNTHIEDNIGGFEDSGTDDDYDDEGISYEDWENLNNKEENKTSNNNNLDDDERLFSDDYSDNYSDDNKENYDNGENNLDD